MGIRIGEVRRFRGGLSNVSTMPNPRVTAEVESGTATVFDPFSDRPARTVRNTLSEMLGGCLERREVFTAPSGDLLRQHPQRPYRDYIQDRVARYRTATREALCASKSPVARAAILMGHGLYFEAHEVLEPHWRAAAGAEKEVLRGLIQAAGAYVHREAGHDAAAARLARKAVARLRRYGEAIGDQPVLDIQHLVVRLTRLTEASPADAAVQGSPSRADGAQ